MVFGFFRAAEYKVRLRPRLFAPGVEESMQQGRGFGSQHAFHNLDAMVQEGRIGDLEFAADATEAKVACTEYQGADARRHQCSGTHRAGLERGVKRGFGQPVIAQGKSGLAERQHFGVCGGIEQGDGRVAALADDFAAHHQDAPYGHFAGFFGFAGKVQRELHPSLVLV